MERTDEDKAARGRQAQTLLADPIMQDALSAMRQQIVDMWAATSAKDSEGREWLWRQYQVALKFEESVLSIVNTGKLAAVNLAEKVSFIDRGKKFFGSER